MSEQELEVMEDAEEVLETPEEISEDEDLLDLLNLRYLELIDLSLCFRITQQGVSAFKQAGFFGKVLIEFLETRSQLS